MASRLDVGTLGAGMMGVAPQRLLRGRMVVVSSQFIAGLPLVVAVSLRLRWVMLVLRLRVAPSRGEMVRASAVSGASVTWRKGGKHQRLLIFKNTIKSFHACK